MTLADHRRAYEQAFRNWVHNPSASNAIARDAKRVNYMMVADAVLDAITNQDDNQRELRLVAEVKLNARPAGYNEPDFSDEKTTVQRMEEVWGAADRQRQ